MVVGTKFWFFLLLRYQGLESVSHIVVVIQSGDPFLKVIENRKEQRKSETISFVNIVC